MSITKACAVRKTAEATEAQSALWSEALPPTGREGELRRRPSPVTSPKRGVTLTSCERVSQMC